MPNGSIVIVNDLLGFCLGVSGRKIKLQDATGVIREVKVHDDIRLHEVTNPYALAKLYYDKLAARVLASR